LEKYKIGQWGWRCWVRGNGHLLGTLALQTRLLDFGLLITESIQHLDQGTTTATLPSVEILSTRAHRLRKNVEGWQQAGVSNLSVLKKKAAVFKSQL